MNCAAAHPEDPDVLCGQPSGHLSQGLPHLPGSGVEDQDVQAWMADHKVIEMMASRWDEGGYRPPTNWRWKCSCGAEKRSLRDQIAASGSWREHARIGGAA